MYSNSDAFIKNNDSPISLQDKCQTDFYRLECVFLATENDTNQKATIVSILDWSLLENEGNCYLAALVIPCLSLENKLFKYINLEIKSILKELKARPINTQREPQVHFYEKKQDLVIIKGKGPNAMKQNEVLIIGRKEKRNRDLYFQGY